MLPLKPNRASRGLGGSAHTHTHTAAQRPPSLSTLHGGGASTHQGTRWCLCLPQGSPRPTRMGGWHRNGLSPLPPYPTPPQDPPPRSKHLTPPIPQHHGRPWPPPSSTAPTARGCRHPGVPCMLPHDTLLSQDSFCSAAAPNPLQIPQGGGGCTLPRAPQPPPRPLCFSAGV